MKSLREGWLEGEGKTLGCVHREEREGKGQEETTMSGLYRKEPQEKGSPVPELESSGLGARVWQVGTEGW